VLRSAPAIFVSNAAEPAATERRKDHRDVSDPKRQVERDLFPDENASDQQAQAASQVSMGNAISVEVTRSKRMAPPA
jgi:hypothetical protein